MLSGSHLISIAFVKILSAADPNPNVFGMMLLAGINTSFSMSISTSLFGVFF